MCPEISASIRHRILLSSLSAIIGYAITIWLLHAIPLTSITALLIPTSSIFLFLWLFRPIKNVVVKNKVELTTAVLFVRACCEASIILVITGIATLVGPQWRGLLSAFPTTLFPLILIIHKTYDATHVHTIIKNVPDGIFSLVLYSMSVSITYPLYGIYWGTVISFVAATCYIIVYQVLKKPSRPKSA